MLRLVGLVLGSLGLGHLLHVVKISLLEEEAPLALARLGLRGPQILPSLVKPGFRLDDTLLEVRLGLVHGRPSGIHLLLASSVESLELVEVGAYSLKELILLGDATADVRFVNNLDPGSSEDLLIKDLPLEWRSGACLSWDADEEVIANLQVPSRGRG